MKGRLIALLISFLIISGCQFNGQQPIKRQVEFPEDEYALLSLEGDSVIEGQLFMRTRGGDVKLGAGMQVVVTPVTSYTREASSAMLSGLRIDNPDPRASAFTRRTIADGEGRFKFSNLPAGNYFVAGEVYWETGARYSLTQGGIVIKEVTVEDGATETVMLTR